jgi:enterochelin esterase-like enzyme
VERNIGRVKAVAKVPSVHSSRGISTSSRAPCGAAQNPASSFPSTARSTTSTDVFPVNRLTRAALLGAALLVSDAAARGGAAPVDPARPAPSARSADTLVIQSAILGEARRVFVSLPASWASTGRPYPVILVLDGEANFSAAGTVAGTLAALGHVPEAIVVGIPNRGGDPMARVHDLTPPGLSVSGSSLDEGGDRFLDFIERELLPRIAERYRGGAPHVLVGHSSGGVLATHAAATRPRSFGVVVAIDAPVHLGDEWLARRLTESASAPGAPPLRYVSLEARFGWPERAWTALAAAAPPSWHLRREALTGESHESMVFLALYQGLKFAFSDYSIVGAPLVPRASAGAAFEHYRRLGTELGADLPPPPTVLRRLVEDLLTEGRADDARRALAWLVEGYGPQRDAAELEAQVARVEALPPLAETVESLLGTPMPTPEEIAPYVGEWRGHHWMNPQARTPFGLRIRVVDGQVVAELLDWFEGPERATRLPYVKVVPGGLHFGQLNGMRPRGVVVHEGVRSGDVLEGEYRFRGVIFPLPGEEAMPPIHFRLEKSPDA